MNRIEKVARGWPALLATVLLAEAGQAQAQTTPALTAPLPGRPPLRVTVYASNPSQPRKLAAPSPRVASEATLARFDQEPSPPMSSPELPNPEIPPGFSPPDPPRDFFLLPTSPGANSPPPTTPAPTMPEDYPATQSNDTGSRQFFSGMPIGSSQQSPLGSPFGPYGGQNPSLNALMNQSVSMPMARSTSRIRVKGPGPVGAGLARFGERLTHFGRTKIESVQETELEAPAHAINEWRLDVLFGGKSADGLVPELSLQSV